MPSPLDHYCELIRSYARASAVGMLRPPSGSLLHRYLVPGSKQYEKQLWDWDSWWSMVALHEAAKGLDRNFAEAVSAHSKGCVLNFLHGVSWDGYVPILLTESPPARPADIHVVNMHKPCLAQKAAFLVQRDGGDAEWLRDCFYALQAFVNNYLTHHRDKDTGLAYYQTDASIAGDNDPCTYGRPHRSSASVFLNCLLYQELLATAYLADRLDLNEVAMPYREEAATLGRSIQVHLWDDWLGLFFSADLAVRTPPGPGAWEHLHKGRARTWDCLVQRIGVWSNFMPMWAGLATPEQVDRMVVHLQDRRTFACAAGVRSLSRAEKMYDVRATGNPSSWLGPVWGIVNYLVFRGLVRCGRDDEARELAEKTIALFGRDIEQSGTLHENYQPDNGKPLLNPGFQNWNLLSLNMISWLKNDAPIVEFEGAGQ